MTKTTWDAVAEVFDNPRTTSILWPAAWNRNSAFSSQHSANSVSPWLEIFEYSKAQRRRERGSPVWLNAKW